MPNYSYKCRSCEETHDAIVSYEDRFFLQKCTVCHTGACEYIFPFEALKGFQETPVYYDEGLGVDVRGRREQKQIMIGQGCQEAGDKVNGARNWDSENVEAVTKQEPRGITYSDMQRREEKARIKKENTIVTALHGDGREISHRVGDNKADTRKSVHVKRSDKSGRKKI